MPGKCTVVVSLSIVWMLLAIPFARGEDNWPRFRGADATGVAPDDPRLPDTWDTQKNVLWKTPIEGRGWGSPIVWGNRVFVSAVHSDDDYEQPKGGLYLGDGRGEPPDTVHHWMVYCLSLDDGSAALETRGQHRQAADSAASQEHLRRRNAHDRRPAAVRAVRRRGTLLLRLRRQAAVDAHDRAEEDALRLRRGRVAGRAGRPGDLRVRQQRGVVHHGAGQRQGEPRWKIVARRKPNLGHAAGVGARRRDRDRHRRRKGKPLVHARRPAQVALRRRDVGADDSFAACGRRAAVHHLGLLPGQQAAGVRHQARGQRRHCAGRKETSNEFIAWSLQQDGPVQHVAHRVRRLLLHAARPRHAHLPRRQDGRAGLRSHAIPAGSQLHRLALGLQRQAVLPRRERRRRT